VNAVAISEGTPANLIDACELWFLADEGPAADTAQRRGAVQRLADELEALWQRPPAHLLLATTDGRLVGTVFAKPRRDDVAMGQISMLAVHPDCQRHGIGNSLLEGALAALVTDGCRHCQMYVAADDQQAHHFYETRGWAFTGQVEASPETGAQERIYRKPLTG
jgi:ribosomal protein S18 acetylase RimI-like enzyme